MSADFPGHYGFRVYLIFITQILARVRFIMIVFSSSLDTMLIISYMYLERLFVGCTVWVWVRACVVCNVSNPVTITLELHVYAECPSIWERRRWLSENEDQEVFMYTCVVIHSVKYPITPSVLNGLALKRYTFTCSIYMFKVSCRSSMPNSRVGLENEPSYNMYKGFLYGADLCCWKKFFLKNLCLVLYSYALESCLDRTNWIIFLWGSFVLLY